MRNSRFATGARIVPSTVRHRAWLRVLAASTTLVAGLLATVLAAPAAHAASGYGVVNSNTGSANVRACPNQGCALEDTYANGRQLFIECYEDSGWASGGHVGQPSTSTDRWFQFRYSSAGDGTWTNFFVLSNLVSPQPRVPSCADAGSGPDYTEPDIVLSSAPGSTATVTVQYFQTGGATFYCHAGGGYPTGGVITKSGTLTVSSENQTWTSLCPGTGDTWVGIIAGDQHSYYSNELSFAAPPPPPPPPASPGALGGYTDETVTGEYVTNSPLVVGGGVENYGGSPITVQEIDFTMIDPDGFYHLTTCTDPGVGELDNVTLQPGQTVECNASFTPDESGDWTYSINYIDQDGQWGGDELYADTQVHIADPAPDQITGAVPTITGTLSAGHVVTAQTGGWSPDGVQLAFQWFLDGQPVPGADTSSIKLSTAWVGKQLSVEVTGQDPGYPDAWETSEPTADIRGGFPKASIYVSGSPGQDAFPIRGERDYVSVDSSDPNHSDIAAYDIRRRYLFRDGSASTWQTWRTLDVSEVGAAGRTFQVFIPHGPHGADVCYDTRSTDGGGIESAWTAQSCFPGADKPTDSTHTGTWSEIRDADAVGGTAMQTGRKGATLDLPRTENLREVGFAAQQGPGTAEVELKVDGRTIFDVDLSGEPVGHGEIQQFSVMLHHPVTGRVQIVDADGKRLRIYYDYTTRVPTNA